MTEVLVPHKGGGDIWEGMSSSSYHSDKELAVLHGICAHWNDAAFQGSSLCVVID